MEFILEFFNALVDLSNAMAPYILFGLFFAGILHELVPDTIVSKHLGKASIGSVIKATVFGVPLPVCSCGVIPLATSIKKSGASNGATLSFLISTPITGVDSILATYGMFGWVFTIYRVITSMIISIIAGILANLFPEHEKKETLFASKISSFSATTPATTNMSFTAVTTRQEDKSLSCSTESPCCSTSNEKKKKFSMFSAMHYAFGTLLSDIAWPLFLGLLIGALITVGVPSNLSEILLEYSWLSYIIVIAIAVPMYICATASLPIAAGLMLSGVSPGAAFVFLSAGPATNTVTIGVVKKMLGTRALYIYLGTIIFGSVIFGFGLDYLLRDMSVKEMIHMHEEARLLEYLSSIVLWILVIYFILKPYFSKKELESCCSNAKV